MNPIEGATALAVARALDAASLRQDAIAANIANANTQGYRPVRVRFEEGLGALRSKLEASGRIEAADLESVHATVEPDPQATPGANGGSMVALDQEVGNLATNSLHYQVLLRALNRQLSIIGTAINDGKR
jgi:flagellar basal-body rod protein FlgB